MKNTFYKMCPVKGCNTISGFCLGIKEINKNGKYFCQECCKDSPLDKWKKSNENSMTKQIRARSYIKFGGLNKDSKDYEIKHVVIGTSKYNINSQSVRRDLKEIKEELSL